MTVAELIAELQKHPGDMQVWTVDLEYGDKPFPSPEMGTLYDAMNPDLQVDAVVFLDKEPPPQRLLKRLLNPRPVLCIDVSG